MNTENLTAVMRAYDDDAPALIPTAERMVAIRRDARRARTRTGVVAALVVVLGAVIPGLLGAYRSVPATPAATRDGLPVWDQGTRLVATAAAEAPGPATLRFTVPAAGSIAVACPAGAVTMRLQVTLNGRAYTPPGFGSAYVPCGSWIVYGPLPNVAYNVFEGDPATVTVALTALRGDNRIDQPVTGRFAIGLRVPVPFDEYPLPPRPDDLPSWSPLAASGPDSYGGWSVPGRALTYESTWPAPDANGDVLVCGMTAEAPGRIDVTIDGTRVATVDIWDYTGREQGLYLTADNLVAMRISPTPGQRFTISFNTREMGGRWSVRCVPARKT